jgi:lipopolysaccharide export system protein LptC
MLQGDGHTRLVGWLKVLLPLAALAILSTLFLVARTVDPMDAVPYAEVDVADRVREPKMTAPEFAGTTADGAALALTARDVRPGDGRAVDARAVEARLDTPDGGSVRMQAAGVAIDPTGARLTLSGGVTMTTSTGYRIAADGIVAATDRTGLSSTGPVEADGPVGRVTAGEMVLTADPDHAGVYLLVFKTGVKLLYRPAE